MPNFLSMVLLYGKITPAYSMRQNRQNGRNLDKDERKKQN